MTSTEENDQQSDLVKNDSNKRGDESTEITIDTYNVTGMDNSSQYRNATLPKKQANHCDILPSWWSVTSKLVKRTNTWSLVISFVILLFLVSLAVKLFQITCICLYLQNVTANSQLYPLSSSFECAYTSVMISNDHHHLSKFPCDTSKLGPGTNVDDDLVRSAQVHLLRLIMCTLLPVTLIICALAVSALRRTNLTIVCISSSILVSHSISFIMLFLISHAPLNQLPVSSVLSISLELATAASVLLLLYVHELHSIMYFNPQNYQHPHPPALDDSHSRLYSIKRIKSTEHVCEMTYQKFEHVDTSFDSSLTPAHLHST